MAKEEEVMIKEGIEVIIKLLTVIACMIGFTISLLLTFFILSALS